MEYNIRDQVPAHTLQAIDNYIEHRYEPGSFLCAVLTNNLRDAIGSADHINRMKLKEIVEYIVWEIPAIAWGSPEKVAAWCAEEV